MTTSEHLIRELLATLKAQAHSCFPKRCSCGQTYANLEEFLTRTIPLERNGGLLRGIEFTDTGIMSILRNCACGSTLLAVFDERRDLSDKGACVRREFRGIVQQLVAAGMDAESARLDLIEAMRGVVSERLRSFLTAEVTQSVDQLTHRVSKPL